MKYIQFFLEYPSKREKRKGTCRKPGNHNGNVLAVMKDNYFWSSGDVACFEAIGALHFSPNSVVCGTSVSDAYLRSRCKRVGENLARSIHPELFIYLDSD